MAISNPQNTKRVCPSKSDGTPYDSSNPLPTTVTNAALADAVTSTLLWSAATSVAMDTSWTSDAITLGNFTAFAVDLVWTGVGTPVGTLTFQCSNDGTNFNDITYSDVAVNGASYALWDVIGSYKYARVKYVRTSGGTGDTAAGVVYLKG